MASKKLKPSTTDTKKSTPSVETQREDKSVPLNAPQAEPTTEETKTMKTTPLLEKDPYKPFKKEIVEKVIRPHLVKVIRQNPSATDEELHDAFRESTKSCVGIRLFRQWLKDSGIKSQWDLGDASNEGSQSA